MNPTDVCWRCDKICYDGEAIEVEEEIFFCTDCYEKAKSAEGK